MLDAIKSDTRKLLTIRSTYILMAVASLIASLIAFYLEAWWGKDGSAAARLSLSSGAMQGILASSAGVMATFACIIAILQAGHEYRYNTIMYTLTASPSRLKVFFSKVLTLSVFSLVACSLGVVLAFGAYILGLKLKGVALPPQDFNVLPELLRASFYFVTYGMFGVLLGMLLRNVTTAIVILFMLSSMVEALLGMVLRDNARYLPISSFDQILGAAAHTGVAMAPNTAVLVSLGYLAGLMIVAWVLFARRDAN